MTRRMLVAVLFITVMIKSMFFFAPRETRVALPRKFLRQHGSWFIARLLQKLIRLDGLPFEFTAAVLCNKEIPFPGGE